MTYDNIQTFAIISMCMNAISSIFAMIIMIKTFKILHKAWENLRIYSEEVHSLDKAIRGVWEYGLSECKKKVAEQNGIKK